MPKYIAKLSQVYELPEFEAKSKVDAGKVASRMFKAFHSKYFKGTEVSIVRKPKKKS